MKIQFYFTILFSLILFSCGKEENKKENGKLYIVATTGMIKDAVANITGDLATVEGLMGPGVDPHLYKPTPGDLSKLRQADVVFYNGLHLEGKMVEVFEKYAREKPVFPVSEGISKDKLKAPDDGAQAYDPHIWFDVSLWKAAVNQISKKLIEFDPDHKSVYQKNTETYLAKLSELDNWVKTEIQKIPENGRVLITAHDAFGYFGLAYDIQVKGLQGISTVSEFGLRDVTELVNFISSRKIKAVFVETSVPSKSLEKVVAGCKENGHEVKIGGTLFSDAMGEEGTEEGTYIGMVKSNVNAIVSSLK
ncbi:metal ABC transporter solute-binding protein, Zn/Mn family [Flexithrix dorotheae]|uniref:metal ABC transporter solute-binding protein, Zn/Mn family n=1 Tax=Flexithrix dorotheae TaxID=70993 RepID=UPI000399BF8E|nr:zinc ABC transporter substrate-binding protein [Flexithrix dorotheae]